jgi:hypothetical protein
MIRWGIYLDQATSRVVVGNNVVYRCNVAAFNQNFGPENTVRPGPPALNRQEHGSFIESVSY